MQVDKKEPEKPKLTQAEQLQKLVKILEPVKIEEEPERKPSKPIKSLFDCSPTLQRALAKQEERKAYKNLKETTAQGPNKVS